MESRTLVELLERSASRFPDRVAAVDSRGATITYADLLARSAALAAFLSHAGVKRGDRVAIAIPKTLDAVISALAALRAGAAYVPIDAGGPIERGREIVRDCGIAAAIVNRRTAAMLPEDAGVCVIAVDDFEHASASFARATRFAGSTVSCAPQEGDLAYIIFTSGSTGAPKGVMITHANAVSFLDWCSSEFQPTEEDRFANYAPLHFDASVIDLYLAIKHGGSVYLVSDELGKRPHDLAAFVSHHQLTFWNSTPSALKMLLRFGSLKEHVAPPLRVVAFGGEVFPAHQLRELQQVWRGAVYYNLYGPSEVTTACTFARLPDVPENRTQPYPIGFPCDHCRAMMLSERGEPTAPGEEGLLYISGPAVFAGYWNRPDDTAAAMVQRNGVSWYNTGDVVRWDDNEGFTYVGRRDRMVKRRGFRIELGEIERALHLHRGVHEAAVISVADQDGTVRIVSFITCSADALSTIELKTFCANVLPAYMSPDAFVIVESLPKTSTDKIDFRALIARAAHVPAR